MTPELAYYADIGAALFPIPHGSKAPYGIVESFAHDWSRSPEQWASWQKQHNCNFGLVAGPSRLVIVDVDVSEVGRETAWRYWSDWCTSHGLPVFSPHCQSARGGWHILFSLPGDLDIATLRQCPLVGKVEGVSKKAIIDLRVGAGFVVAAGSYYDGTTKGEASGAYTLFPDATLPHAAPTALLAACARVIPAASPGKIGSRDRGDVAGLLQWMTEKDMFSEYSEWLGAGLALKLEYGDDGAELWEICHDATVTQEVAVNKWSSFAADPKPGMATLNSLLKRAHAAGWKGTIRTSTSAMFSDLPNAPQSLLAGRGAIHARLFAPVLAAVPLLPRLPEHPTFLLHDPHPLQDAINAAIPAICADPATHILAHAVINLIHPQTAALVFPITPLVSARTAALESQEVQALSPDAWATDEKGKIQGDNAKNVEFYLNGLGVSVRWNEWFEYAELKGWKWPRWTRVDDRMLAVLRMHATKTGTRFVMGKEFAADALLELSTANAVDPACELLAKWEAAWDGMSRIDTWLSRACGVPDNPYYRAVSRTILLGLVGRIRHPGIKFDLMMVLISQKQGTEKSSLAKVLALNNEWFADNVSLGQESKELVLLLAGKTVGEVKEMRSRGDVEAAKAMIDTTHDEGRTAYARFTTKRARRNILIGSTNKPDFLEDPTGARRFLPVHVVGSVDLAWVRQVLPQLVGEAAAALAGEIAKHNGEKIELPPEVWDIAAEYQEAARAQSDFEIYLQEWFAGNAPGYITSGDLASLLKEATGRSIAPQQYSKTMRGLGFEKDQARKEGRLWTRGNGSRWQVRRDAQGRTSPSQMFASVGVTGQVAKM